MRGLIVTATTDPARRQALAELLPERAEVTFAEVNVGADGGAFDAVVVDRAGGQLPADLAVPTSGCLVEIGVESGEHQPRGEYFVKIAPGGSPLTARMPGEFPVVDRWQTVAVPPGGAAMAHVSVGFRDRPVVVKTDRAVRSGLGIETAALRHPEVRRLLQRALQPATAGQARRHGLAVVGYGSYGGMGYYHGIAARAVDGLEFVATCDTSPERRKAAESDFPGVRAYASVDDLVTDDDVDVVVIATPPVHHAELAGQLLAAGKHVVCEKPLCLTTADADALIAGAAAAGRVLTVHQNRRWDTDFLAIRNAVDAGLLGEVFNVETFVGGFEHPCRAWHSEESLSGGAVYDWGSHHIDWILQLMGGPPAEVRCHGHKRVWHDVTNLDQIRVHMRWADGREAEFFQSDIAAIRRPKFYVQGTAGTLVGSYRPVVFERLEAGRGYVAEPAHHAEAPADLRLARYQSGAGLVDSQLPLPAEQRFAFHRNLADHLALGEPLAVTPESVRDVVAVLEAAHRSAS